MLPLRKDKIPAVILGDDHINGLGVARNLGRAGIKVYRLGAMNNRLFRSRYIVSSNIIPGINELNEDEYIGSLINISNEIGEKPVLFPITDIHVLNVSQYSETLKEYFYLTASDLISTKKLVNKGLFYRSLKEMGIPHPKTFFIRNVDEFDNAVDEIDFPILIKPEISPLFSMKFGIKGFIVHSRTELDEYMDTISSSGLAYLIQEIIPGGAKFMSGCAGFKNDSTIYSFCYQRIREFPIVLGNGSAILSIPSYIKNTKLSEYLNRINYNGIFDAEFKFDSRDGVFKLIEINARSWWQNILPTESGINLVKIAYEHAIGNNQFSMTKCFRYEYGVKWIHLYNDFFSARESNIAFLNWVRTIRGRKAFAIWALDDAYPMIFLLSSIFNNKMRKLLIRKL